MHYEDINAISEIFFIFGIFGTIISTFRGVFPYIGFGLLTIGLILYVVAFVLFFKQNK